MNIENAVRRNVPLAPLTTLELGGNAQYFLESFDEETTLQAVEWAKQKNLPLFVLGGGSNVVISDQGFLGLVLHMQDRGISIVESCKVACDKQPASQVLVTAKAGEPWDAFVAFTVEQGLAGLECLSGIPGFCGATPVQNVGAYGQEVSDTLREVRVLDRESLSIVNLKNSDCAFGYRTSLLKRQPQKYIVLSVTFSLTFQGGPTLKYPELAKYVLTRHPTPLLRHVREDVLTLRRAKSMLLDPTDENRRSVGSFFLNPIVTLKESKSLVKTAIRKGLVLTEKEIPQFPVEGDRVKFPAAWLIEKAGIRKGQRFGPVGVSSKHSLCLVHYGNGTTKELVQAAQAIQTAVNETFGIKLHPEPNFVGFLDAELKSLG